MKHDADQQHEKDEKQNGLGDEIAELSRAAFKFLKTKVRPGLNS
jgi:hypothetical protein